MKGYLGRILIFFWGSLMCAQQYQSVDFIQARASLHIDPYTPKIVGEITYKFEILKPIDTLSIDAQNMTFDQVVLDGQPAKYWVTNHRLYWVGDFEAVTQHSLSITYSASPKKAMYFVGWDKDKDKDKALSVSSKLRSQVWTQGQGQYTSHWLPSFDEVNEKVIFELSINFPKGYEVVANGRLDAKKTIRDQTIWEYKMEHPMSSYLLAIVAGNYLKKTDFSRSGIPLEFYYYPEDATKFEPTYRYSQNIFDFLESEIGVTYPWQNYKQIPVKDFMYAGMENTGTTIFSDAFVVDSTTYKDRNYSNVNAHELAHQWFGNLVTASHGTHHWLQEGFATYYALLAERDLLGDAYFYYKLYESAEQLEAVNREGKSTSLLNPKASSLTFYQRGAWALFALQNTMGREAFRTAIRRYLETYRFKCATTADFLDIAKTVSGMDLIPFRSLWLEATDFPTDQAVKLLQQSPFLRRYLALVQRRSQPLIDKKHEIALALDFPVDAYMGQEAVHQLATHRSSEAIALYQKAFETHDVLVRQTIAMTLSEIPQALKQSYETLLQDDSYATVEAALYHLWTNFPKDRSRYLKQTKEITGFRDHNVRLLWLALAINTPAYHSGDTEKFYQRLFSYTAPIFGTSTREKAFTYLEGLQRFSDTALVHLAASTVHHQWRYRKACRGIWQRLIRQAGYRDRYEALKPKLSIPQKTYLDAQLPVKGQKGQD